MLLLYFLLHLLWSAFFFLYGVGFFCVCQWTSAHWFVWYLIQQHRCSHVLISPINALEVKKKNITSSHSAVPLISFWMLLDVILNQHLKLFFFKPGMHVHSPNSNIKCILLMSKLCIITSKRSNSFSSFTLMPIVMRGLTLIPSSIPNLRMFLSTASCLCTCHSGKNLI